MKCKHESWYINHREGPDYVWEFCLYENCKYKRKLIGEESNKWKDILHKVNKD